MNSSAVCVFLHWVKRPLNATELSEKERRKQHGGKDKYKRCISLDKQHMYIKFNILNVQEIGFKYHKVSPKSPMNDAGTTWVNQ